MGRTMPVHGDTPLRRLPELQFAPSQGYASGDVTYALTLLLTNPPCR